MIDMTIDESIARERKLAEIYRNDIVPKEDYHNMPWIDMANEGNEKAAEEHEQLAKWLEELKALREEKSNFLIFAKDIAEANYEMGMESGYNKAIDECNKKLDELERNYQSCYGTKIIEMYADVYEDFRAWLRSKND